MERKYRTIDGAQLTLLIRTDHLVTLYIRAFVLSPSLAISVNPFNARRVPRAGLVGHRSLTVLFERPRGVPRTLVGVGTERGGIQSSFLVTRETNDSRI